MRRGVILSAICIGQLLITTAVLGYGPDTGMTAAEAAPPEATFDSGPEENRSIQWFKEELRITPKYTEDHKDVFGLSWAHFLTMVLLILFSLFGLASLLIRYRRTKELLTKLLEEKKHESQD